MKVAHAVFAFWLILIAAAVLLSGCALVESPNLSTQMQRATVSPLPSVVFSDANVWQVVGYNVASWSDNKAVSELFLYSAEVSLAALTAAILVKPGAAQGLAVGQGLWMAVLKIFKPAEFSLAYTQGMLLINTSTAEYTMCLAATGRVVVPRNLFTPCGAVLYMRMVSAVNLVMSLKSQLLPQAQDVVNVLPPRLELPTAMRLPTKELTAPQPTIP